MTSSQKFESFDKKISEIINSSIHVTPGKFLCRSEMPDKDITIFIACYNEEENIVATLGEVISAMGELALSWEIIVIDDASSDNSVDSIKRYISEHPDYPVALVVRTTNQGLARNFLDAAFLGSGRYYKLVCGDNVESREQIISLLNHIGEADILIPNAKILGRTFLRQLLSSLFTGLVNLISGNNIGYYNGCSVHLRQNVMLWHRNVTGFDFQAKLILTLLDQGKTYSEIPVIHHERAFGHSNALTRKNVLSAALFFMDLIFRRIGRIFSGRKKGIIE